MSEVDRRTLIKSALAALSLPALPFSIANAIAGPRSEPCPEFPFFGAHYPDATCIDGYLWDLDSCEGDGMLHSGGDYPCPYCNAGEFLDYLKDDIEERGWIAFTEGEPPLANPYLKGCRFPHLTDQFQRMWSEGYRSASLDTMAIEDRAEAERASRSSQEGR